MKKDQSIDLAPYLQAFALVFRHPSIFAMPLLAAVVDLVFSQLANVVTDPIGGAGASLFPWISQVVYLWAFGVAIIQANNIWRGHRGTFEEAWDEARPRFGAIALAAIGFLFVVWAASVIGQFFGVLSLLLGAVAAFFLIYTIPAAAIGGLPGSLAISASIRAVRATPARAVVLAVVFFVLWFVGVPLGLPFLLVNLSPIFGSLIMAAAQALVLGYLALPFAKEYDDIALTRYL